MNFWGSVYPTFFAIPHLKKTKGKVFVNASAGVYIPVARMSIYAVSNIFYCNFWWMGNWGLIILFIWAGK